jgi:DNA-nicking Smr family endonuclease
MPRRRQRAGADASKRTSGIAPLNAPFRGLRNRLGSHAPAPSKAAPTTPPPVVPPAPPADDDSLFRRAMEGVDRLPDAERARIAGPAPAAVPRAPVSEEAESLALLSDLVNGEVRFEIPDTREYVEGYVVGLDVRVLRRLRKGDYAWQAWIDLHGMTAATARDEIERFILAAVRDGHRCVLVVHGRGHNSKDQMPVLKEGVKSWLARGRIGRHVLAFTSARAVDGGAGALYVLLRRDRKRRPIQVAEGAKR